MSVSIGSGYPCRSYGRGIRPNCLSRISGQFQALLRKIGFVFQEELVSVVHPVGFNGLGFLAAKSFLWVWPLTHVETGRM